jgi:hypothetical protein
VVEGDREVVVLEFGNGGAVRYRPVDGTVEERWVPPEAGPTDPARVVEREADGTGRGAAESLALRTLGEYLSFDDRRHAAFVWGEANLDALTD